MEGIFGEICKGEEMEYGMKKISNRYIFIFYKK